MGPSMKGVPLIILCCLLAIDGTGTFRFASPGVGCAKEKFEEPLPAMK